MSITYSLNLTGKTYRFFDLDIENEEDFNIDPNLRADKQKVAYAVESIYRGYFLLSLLDNILQLNLDVWFFSKMKIDTNNSPLKSFRELKINYA